MSLKLCSERAGLGCVSATQPYRTIEGVNGPPQVMGPPLAGSDVRAYVVTGGGLRLRGWLPRYRSRRVQMIFPLRGTEKRGLVSLEAKRRKVDRHSRPCNI